VKITVSEIPEEGLELELKEDISSDLLKFLSPVSAKIRIDKQESEIFVRGFISCQVEQQCSRCLKSFGAKITSNLNVVYRPFDYMGREEHYELKEDELETGFFKNDTLDTDDLLREQVFLNISMKPLCSSDCKGLCPRCGADLNATSCTCKTPEIDSRLAVLEQLLKERSK